jgi:hypothetical protein
MLNYLKKFAMDILPSVAATIIGAYIVNHYIATKSPADAPAAVVSTAETKMAEPQGAPKVVAAKPADASTDVANVPEAGVTAKGVSERAMIEKTAAERPAETKPVDAKSAEIKPIDTANLPTDPHHRALQPREKAVAKVTPAPVAGPVIATPVAAASLTGLPPAESAAAPAEEHRDANELARQAIERLRANGDAASRLQEAPREMPRETRAAPAVALAPAVRPLPPPVILATPPAEPSDAAATSPPYTASVPANDPNRPIPPAEIPPPRPRLDLRAEAANAASHANTVAQDVLAAAKSMFHAVLPGSEHEQNGNGGRQQFAD